MLINKIASEYSLYFFLILIKQINIIFYFKKGLIVRIVKFFYQKTDKKLIGKEIFVKKF